MAVGGGSRLRCLAVGALLLAASAGPAFAQSVTPSKQVFDGNESVEIRYSLPDNCPRCELHIVGLSDILRHENFDTWIRELFLQPGKHDRMPVFYTYSEKSERLVAGSSGTYSYPARNLRAKTDAGRGWYRALLISNATIILAQAPFMVVHRYGAGTGKAELLDGAGTPLEGIVGPNAPMAVLSGTAGGSGDVLHGDLWQIGAASPRRSWGNSADKSQRGFRLDTLWPGSYELRFKDYYPGIVLGSRSFDVVWPYRENALALSWPNPGSGAQLPQVAIDYPGRNYRLHLFRLGGVQPERLWGWELRANGSLDLGQRPPQELRALPPGDYELRALPPGDYELRLYLGDNPNGGRYLLSRKTFAIAGDKPAPAPVAPPAQLALAAGRPVLAGDNFEVSYSAPAGDAAQPVWLAIFPKTRILTGCTIYEQAPPMAITQGRVGNAQFRYPINLSGSGSLTLQAPWQPGEYEVRIYRGQEQLEPRFLADTKTTLLAAVPLTIGLAQPLFTVKASIGAVVPLGTPIEVEIAPSAEFKRNLFQAWRVQALIVRATEKLPGGGIRPEHVVQSQEAMDGRPLSFKPIDLDPGPYELQVIASAPGENFLRFLTRQRFDVPPPAIPPLPGDAAFARSPGFTTPDGYSPRFEPQPDCRTPVAAVQPPPAPKPPEDQPVLRIVEWLGGDESTDADDSYRPVASIFPGHPYMIEARFPKAQDAPTQTVIGPGSAAITLRRTPSDPALYRSELIVLERPR